MDALATIGALAASEGTNAMAILAPVELPPGHVSWTSKDICSADQAFASQDQPSLLQTWLATGACLIAWKEAIFEGFKTKDEDKEPEEKEPR